MDDDLEHGLFYLMLLSSVPLLPLALMLQAGWPWAFELLVVNGIGLVLLVAALLCRGMWLNYQQGQIRKGKR